jgi:putative endonuclease
MAEAIRLGRTPSAELVAAARPRIIRLVSEYFCYILECADGTFYTGWTTDPERRLKQHSAGRGARYTRARRPLRLAYLEPQTDRRAAMLRERCLKHLTRQRKLALIRQHDASGPSACDVPEGCND